MKLNDNGINLIKSFESCRLHAYPDPATKGEPYTIGWGHTGKGVTKDSSWTQEQADAVFLHDLYVTCQGIYPLLKQDLTDNQFSAIVSLVYNIGIGNFKKSTLLKLLNLGAFENAAKEFLKWNKAAGKEMKGLTRRRLAEQMLFHLA